MNAPDKQADAFAKLDKLKERIAKPTAQQNRLVARETISKLNTREPRPEPKHQYSNVPSKEPVRIYYNANQNAQRVGYAQSDQMHNIWSGTMRTAPDATVKQQLDNVASVFGAGNRPLKDDRPLSRGDVVVLQNIPFEVKEQGFKELNRFPPENYSRGRGWNEVDALAKVASRLAERTKTVKIVAPAQQGKEMGRGD